MSFKHTYEAFFLDPKLVTPKERLLLLYFADAASYDGGVGVHLDRAHMRTSLSEKEIIHLMERLEKKKFIIPAENPLPTLIGGKYYELNYSRE